MTDLTSAVVQEMAALEETFYPDELAYLALTSKIELPVRDRLAYRLSRRFPELLIAREWYRCDLAILSEEAVPLLLLEAKALYTFDMVGEPAGTWIARYPDKVKADIEKSIRSARRTADSEIVPWCLWFIRRSLRQIDSARWRSTGRGSVKAFRELETAEAIHETASQNLRTKLSSLGPITTGTIQGGTAYDVEVDVDYWVVGPASLWWQARKRFQLDFGSTRRPTYRLESSRTSVAELYASLPPEFKNVEVKVRDRIKGEDGTYEFDATVRYEWGGMEFLIVVEAKRHAAPIKREVVQILRQKISSVGAHKGVLLSTSPFQSGALEFAKTHGIALVHVTEGRFTYMTKAADPPPVPTREEAAQRFGLPTFVGHAYGPGEDQKSTRITLISPEHPEYVVECLLPHPPAD